MSERNVLHNLQASITNFGLAPRKGFKLCIRCKTTEPEAAFYKCDLDDPTALCKKHKEEERSSNKQLSKLHKLDVPQEVSQEEAVLGTAGDQDVLDTSSTVEEEADHGKN